MLLLIIIDVISGVIIHIIFQVIEIFKLFDTVGLFSAPNGNQWPMTDKHPAIPSSTVSAASRGGPALQPAEKYSAVTEFESVFDQGSGPLSRGSGTVTTQGAGLDWSMQMPTSRGGGCADSGGGSVEGGGGHQVSAAGQHSAS